MSVAGPRTVSSALRRNCLYLLLVVLDIKELERGVVAEGGRDAVGVEWRLGGLLHID